MFQWEKNDCVAVYIFRKSDSNCQKIVADTKILWVNVLFFLLENGDFGPPGAEKLFLFRQNIGMFD